MGNDFCVRTLWQQAAGLLSLINKGSLGRAGGLEEKSPIRLRDTTEGLQS